MERDDIWRVEVDAWASYQGVLKDRKLSRFNTIEIMFDLVNVEGKLVYSLHFETFHGTINKLTPVPRRHRGGRREVLMT